MPSPSRDAAPTASTEDPTQELPPSQERVLSENTPPFIVQAACQSLFAAELLKPSDEIWIFLPYVWNVQMLDNRANLFRHVEPNWPQANIRIVSVLKKCAEEGSQIRILTTDARKNETFVDEVNALNVQAASITVKQVSKWSNRPKLLATSRFSLRGGLSLSKKSGLTTTAAVRVSTEASIIASDLDECHTQWNAP